MNISNNISSITSHQTMMNSSANNIANSNTDKYIPTDVRMVNSSGSSVGVDVRQVDDRGYNKSQTDLSKEIPDQMIADKATSFNVATIKTQDEMVGSLLDIKA